MYQTKPLGERISAFVRDPSALSRFILVNCSVWLLVSLSKVVAFLFRTPEYPADTIWISKIQYLFSVPASLPALIARPWSILTYMFLQINFWHLFFNMFWLYWFGKIFLEFKPGKKMVSVYLTGGIAGAIVFISAYNFFPAFAAARDQAMALGSSASVLAIVVATSVLVPDYTVNLMFIGNVKIKYIALFSILLDILMIPAGNAGGHFAHLGGALAGLLYIKLPAVFPSASFLNSMFRSRPGRNKFKTVHRNNRPLSDEEYNQLRAQNQKKVDNILDKIAKSGYKSLTEEEKEFLFKYSNK